MERVIDLGNLIIPLIKPQKGVDYYTASEKQELVNIITNNVNEVVLPQEEIRQSNEVIRQDNEATRQSQEDTRQSNETSRQTAETARASAENTRQSNETSRVSAEETRAQTFSSQMDAVDTAIAEINTSQTAFNENATNKTSDFNTNATNKTTAFNENATSKTNAFDEHTAEIQAKLATIETGAEVNVIDSVKVNGTELTPTDKEVNVSVPTKTSDLTNDSGFGTYTKPNGGIPKTDLSSDVQTSLGKADSAIQDISGKEDSSNKVIELTDESTDTEYPSAKAVYDELESVKAENKVLKSEVANQQKILDQMPKVSGEGTEFTLNNTIEAEFAEYSVEGRSVQETTEGRQLLHDSDGSKTLNGVTFTENTEDGSVLINGTATANTTFEYFNKQWTTFPAGTYRLSGTPSSASATTHRLICWKEGWTVLGTDIGDGTTITLSEDTKIRVQIVIASGTTVNNAVYKPMLEPGSTTHPWEKYTGGIASPNVDYPSERYSAGGNVNEFDKDNMNVFYTYIGQTTGKIASTEDTTGNFRTIYIKCKANTKYAINKNVGYPSMIIGCSEGVPALGTTLNDYVQVSSKSYIYETINSAEYLVVQVTNNNDNLSGFEIQEIIDNFKIEKGTKASPYSPYGMGCVTQKIVNKNLFDGKIELGGINPNDGSLIANNARTRSKNFIKVKPNTTFTLTRQSGQYRWIVGYTKNKVGITDGNYDGRPSAIEQIHFADTLTKTFTTTPTTEYIKWYDTGSIDLTEEVMIEENSTSTSYIVHKEQTYTIPVQQEMRSIGTVRDKFVKNNGIKYERHNIARYTLTGTESWMKQWDTSGTNHIFMLDRFFSNSKSYSDYTSNILCQSNSFIGTFQASGTGSMWTERNNDNYPYLMCINDNSSIPGTGGAGSLIIKCQDYTTVESFKAYLAEQYSNGTPVYVDYIVAEPLDLPCTQEQIDVLESPPETYAEQTNVFSEDTVPANVKASGYLDLNSLVTRVAQLETEV